MHTEGLRISIARDIEPVARGDDIQLEDQGPSTDGKIKVRSDIHVDVA